MSDTLALWKAGVKQRYASTCGEDALPLLGDARQLEQAPGETAAAYRLRLVRAFEIHTDRTTKQAYRHVLEPLGVAPADVYPWNHYEAGIGDWWSTVWIVVDATGGPWGPANEFDDGLTLDSGLVLDISGITENDIHYIRRNVRKTKWAGAYPVGIWAVLAGQALDMGLAFDSGLLLDVVTDIALIPLGKTWDQEAVLWGMTPATLDAGDTLDPAFWE